MVVEWLEVGVRGGILGVIQRQVGPVVPLPETLMYIFKMAHVRIIFIQLQHMLMPVAALSRFRRRSEMLLFPLFV